MELLEIEKLLNKKTRTELIDLILSIDNIEELLEKEIIICWMEENLWGYACNHCQVNTDKPNLDYCPHCGAKVLGYS